MKNRSPAERHSCELTRAIFSFEDLRSFQCRKAAPVPQDLFLSGLQEQQPTSSQPKLAEDGENKTLWGKF